MQSIVNIWFSLMPADEKRLHNSSALHRISPCFAMCNLLKVCWHWTRRLNTSLDLPSVCRNRLVTKNLLTSKIDDGGITVNAALSYRCLKYLLYVSHWTRILFLSWVFGIARHWYPTSKSECNELRRLRYCELLTLIRDFELLIARGCGMAIGSQGFKYIQEGIFSPNCIWL